MQLVSCDICVPLRIPSWIGALLEKTIAPLRPGKEAVLSLLLLAALRLTDAGG